MGNLCVRTSQVPPHSRPGFGSLAAGCPPPPPPLLRLYRRMAGGPPHPPPPPPPVEQPARYGHTTWDLPGPVRTNLVLPAPLPPPATYGHAFYSPPTTPPPVTAPHPRAPPCMMPKMHCGAKITKPFIFIFYVLIILHLCSHMYVFEFTITVNVCLYISNVSSEGWRGRLFDAI